MNGRKKITARQVAKAACAAIEKPAPDPEDVAFAKSQDARDAADRFLSAVRAVLPHVANLGDVERSACAYTIVHACNAVMQELEDHGEVENTVVVGVLGEAVSAATEKTDTKSDEIDIYEAKIVRQHQLDRAQKERLRMMSDIGGYYYDLPVDFSVMTDDERSARANELRAYARQFNALARKIREDGA